MKRYIILILAALLSAGVLLAAMKASAKEALTASAARAADIAVFREQIMARDRAFIRDARAEAEVRLTALEGQVDTVSQAYFELELSRIVALADNGHTATFAGPRSRRYNRVDIRLAPFGDAFYVLRATPENADLLGARLVSIDGYTAADVRDVGRSLAGGVPSWRDRQVSYFLESPEQMHALGVIANPDAATYLFETQAGARVERRLAGAPANPDRPRANAERWFYPEPMPEEMGQWRVALAERSAPWSLREPGVPFRWRVAEDIDAMVIELRQNSDAEGRPIATFLAEMTRELNARKPRNVVLDMRMNGGGDLNTTRDFVESLPRLVQGRVFVLTSPWTFSAAISSTGYLEQAAPARVTIVGEPVGDRLKFFAEGQPFELPHSHALILPATERHDYVNGCRGMTDCHGSVVRDPIAVPTLAPDISAPWTIEAYLAGRDPGMDAIAASLR